MPHRSTPSFRPGTFSRRWTCALVTAALVLGSIGCPSPGMGEPGGCRCDEKLRAAGECCCAKRLAATASCCSAETKSCCASQTRPCCVNRQQPTGESCCSQKTSATNHDGLPGITACCCGGKTPESMLINTDPRLPAPTIHLAILWLTSTVVAAEATFASCCLPPDTPPPKFSRS